MGLAGFQQFLDRSDGFRIMQLRIVVRIGLLMQFFVEFSINLPFLLKRHGGELRQAFGDHGGRIMVWGGNVKPGGRRIGGGVKRLLFFPRPLLS